MLPDKIGRYEILRELGRGGMATVYLARDPAFRRRVAVKVLPPGFAHTPEFRARFEREAQVIAALEHPYIVPVYDFGEDPETGQPFLVMRYMPGGTLVDRIAGRPMPLAHVVPIIQRIAEALEEAHSQSIIHRDLKPANVMFDARDQAFLSDFGLAKMFDNNTTAITLTGVMGTPAYMSPEQALGDDLDGRSDVYALGVVLYEMLTGRQPYEAKTPAAMMIKHVTVITPLIDTERLSLPAECNQVLAAALAKNRDERYRTPAALAEGIMALAPSGRVRKPKPLPPHRQTRTMDTQPTVQLSSMLGLDPLAPRKIVALRRAVLGGALSGGLVILLIGGYWWWSSTGSVVGATNTLTPTLAATNTVATTTSGIGATTSTNEPTVTRPLPTPTPSLPILTNTLVIIPSETTRATDTRRPAATQVIPPTVRPTQPPADTALPSPTNSKPPPSDTPGPTDIPPASSTPTLEEPPPSETPTPVP